MTDDERAILDEIVRRSIGYSPEHPTKPQRDFMMLTETEALYGGAAGGGKSSALLLAYLGTPSDPAKYVRIPGYAGLILRRTYKDLALPGAIMDRALAWFSRHSDIRWSADDKTFTFPSGAKLTFGYLERQNDHLRYQGAEFQYIAFDELTQFSERQYLYLRSRLRKRSNDTMSRVPLRIRAATNPGGPGHYWVHRRFFGANDSDRAFVPARLDDNPHLDASYLRSLEGLDPITFEQLRNGSWAVDTSQLVYKLGAHNTCDFLPQASAPWRYILGVDYGNVDSTALVVIAYNKHDTCAYVVESGSWGGLTPSDAADLVRTWSERYTIDTIVADVGGLGKGYAEEAKKRWGLVIEPAQKTDKLGYIKLLNGDLHHSKLKILNHNTALLSELRTLSWSDEWHDEENQQQSNHLCDAMLYAWRHAWHFRAVAEAPVLEKPRMIADAYKRRLQERNNNKHFGR